MGRKRKLRRVLSGLMAVFTIMSTVLSPLTAYASELVPEEPKPPLYEEVKDQLDADEVVTAKDYEMEIGYNFDLKVDFSNIEIPDNLKVKVTFEEAKNADGWDFANNHADTYKAVYYVEPLTTDHPKYQISRNLIVKEPVTETQAEVVTESGQNFQEAEESADDGESDSQADIPTAYSEMPVSSGLVLSEALTENNVEAVSEERADISDVSGEEITEQETSQDDIDLYEPETERTEEETFSEEITSEVTEVMETEESVDHVTEETEDILVVEPETEISSEPESGMETEAGTEIETEIETETESETETEKEGDYQVNITRGEELGITLDHEDGSYDAGETVTFSTNMPEGSLTAVGALKVAGNEAGNTADLLYSEVTYNAAADTFSFEMPADDIALEVASDYAEGGIMLMAAGDENPWDEATEIEANTYYYYSDGTLHPFNSVMGSGGNDSYKYVRYKVNGKTYTVNAYCMQHSMASPPSGTTYKNMIELDEGGDDKYLRKALFYGYGGPGWGQTFNGYSIKTIMTNAGCTSETRAMQHYLVDYLYDGESGFGGALSTTAKNMLKEIKAALAKMPDPTAMELLPGLSVTANGRDTESFTWKANEAFTLTIHLENGVSLVNETTGKTSTGNVTVKGGDKFHLTATTDNISSLSGNYAITSNYPLDFHAMLLKLQNSQDIGFGYYTDSSEISLSVDWPEQAQLDIVKQDGGSGAKLAGAVYGVYSDAACQNLIVQMPATDNNGASSVTFNVTGSTVYLKELTAPKGYQLNVNAVGVAVAAGKTSSQTLTDTEILGSLKIYKEGQVLTGAATGADGTTFQYENRRLAGAVYTVTAAEDIVAADGRTVLKKGAVAAENVVTGADGSVTVSNLHLGKYTVTETGAPKNYINKGEAKTVTIASSDQTAEVVFAEVTFTNDRQKAELSVVKQDKETNSPLSGGVFALYADSDIKNVDGTVVAPKDTLIGKVTTGSDGYGKFSADLPIGYSYYVKEIQAPDQFLLNTSDVYRFSFAYTSDKEATVKFTHTFINEEPRGNITIYKEGEMLAGASVTDNGTVFQYDLRKQKGAVYDVYAGADIKTAAGKLIYQKGAVVAENLITGEDGSVTLSGLYLGTYTVKEKTAPQNFVNKGETKNVTLSYNGQTEKVVLGNTTFQNDRQKVAVTVTKVDNTTKNPLSGGIYGLYAAEDIKNVDGTVVVKKDTFIEKVTTGADGRAVYTADLPVGYSYYVKELQAPDCYVRNTDDIYTFTFRYTHDGEATVNFSHTFENERVNAKINLVKKDAETGNTPQGDATLEKAVYGLYAREDIVHPDKKTGVIYKAGTQIATLTTDAKGEASIGDLYLGKYYVKEITPSNGYLLDEKEYDLSCDFEGDLVATVERTATSLEQVIKQPFQLIKVADNDKTDADLLSGVGFTAYLVSSLKVKEDGSYDFASAEPVVIGENSATEIYTNNKGHAVSIAIPFGTYIVRETTTPHNFKPVDDFIVRITENHPTEPQVWRVLLDDEFQAKLKIIKQDDETGKSVLAAGTEFKVFDLDNNVYVEQVTTYPTTVTHTSYFTDSEGYLILPNNLLAGNYRIEEVTAPEGYTINRNYVNIKVDTDTMYQIDQTSGDAIIEVVYENHPVKGELQVIKKGEVLSGYRKDFEYEIHSLAGAVFAVFAAEDIYTADYQMDAEGNRICEYCAGELVAEITTGEDGKAVLGDLPLGSYRVIETKAPEGYVLNTQAQEVTFTYAGQETPVITQTAEFVNDRQRVEVKAVKKDAENESLLAGAVFGIYAKEDIKVGDAVIVKADTLLAEATTGEDGCAVFEKDLPFADFYVKELQAPAGYVFTAEAHEIHAVYQGQDVPVAAFIAEFHNKPTVTEFTKSDITTGTELDGATLTVLDKDKKVIDTWTSVKDEPHVIKRLHVGETYILREEFAPYGYLKATDAEFTIADTGEVQKVGMKDEVPTALLIINKKGEFLDKVTLLNNAKGTVEHLFEYVTGNLTEVSFEVYAAEDIKAADGISADYYKADELVTTITTDANGIAQAGDLPVGKYYVKEVETAHGYVLDGEPRYVDLSYRDQDTPVVTYSEQWQNARQKVIVHVLKKEKDSERVLKGGVFGLFAAEDIKGANGKVLMEADTLIEQRTTDDNGQITFTADLPVDGKYYVQEQSAPDGFVTTDEKQEFVFEYQGETEKTVSYDFTFENEPTTVELTKADLTTGKELPGAHLRVIDEKGDLVDEWVSGNEPHVIKELVVGKSYTMIETKPADGFVTAESLDFTVENTAEIQKHEMLDDVTKVEISKTDITGTQEVPGAKITILDEDDQVVERWTSTNEPHYVEKLPVGKYTLREERAPKGYVLTEDVTFEVLDTGEIQSVQMKNDTAKGKIILNKTDKETGKPLKGVEFELRDSKGKVLETLKTDAAGHAESRLYEIATYVDGAYGAAVKYYLVETKTLDGYKLEENQQEIVFAYVDQATPIIEVKLEVKNEPVPVTPENPGTPGTPTDAPKTGDQTPIIPLIALMVGAVCILAILLVKKKNRYKK